MSDLPSGWVEATLSAVTTINPVADKKSIALEAWVNFVPMPAVGAETGRIDVSEQRRFAKVKTGYTPFLENDVLFAKITPCMENGKMAVVPKLPHLFGFGSTEFHVLRCPEGVLPEFVYLHVSSLKFRYDAEHNMTGAVGQKRVPEPYLAQTAFPLPPTNEQRRIMGKVESLFTELDKGEESLRAARARAGLYRQSLLKYAFEGHLTADWRAANPDKLETPEILLARIQVERDTRYKQALDDWQIDLEKWRDAGEQGKKPAKPKRQNDFVTLSHEVVVELPQVPEKWGYSKLANLGDLGRGKSKHRPRNDPRLLGGPYPLIQTGDVKSAGRIIREYTQSYTEFGLSQSKLWPKGTLCITIAANIAETAFLGFDSCFPDSVVGFSSFEEMISPFYIELFIKGVRQRIEAYAPATAQKNINLTTLEELVIPLCSPAEQAEIVSRLEAKLSTLDALEVQIEAQLARSKALRQSILKQAFAGKLVAQDPSDEPASELLKRIQAEKAATSKPTRKKKAAHAS
ncbi:restriction endonuclease subunit S [Pseudosulfitobacter pseudonitzschiae]|uniref:restriction endonuclease subunit S n=1 Tax=Pseudosulfitobacter pseudonitzschiae TaxID=1402135 RepID=UPI001AFBCDA5|nr:restriction endonuclease subunit S [Pseudosulfitobacter pseudonitzschiae]MBM1817450.1 restriction endonuclease subunit S [Pseudosulfitobacter pseudonitzschiae]MBM1834459.1 restriction endonuclease subunit S [Pseudosulfitobacter pseudonitzschiae]MBM1839226.1 restriction endonuclease subunit S [Pseudosulfitobacter pseudonitzschiae]MBM1844174.1 restriction endonuclease subunit S [Pseudosulfitobacter pseudonitzschiae]MBM1848911.1 restriction endonuclease subunit S [Pseudosulfitobacter pseudonit